MKVGSIESLRGMPASIAPNTATLSLSLSLYSLCSTLKIRQPAFILSTFHLSRSPLLAHQYLSIIRTSMVSRARLTIELQLLHRISNVIDSNEISVLRNILHSLEITFVSRAEQGIGWMKDTALGRRWYMRRTSMQVHIFEDIIKEVEIILLFKYSGKRYSFSILYVFLHYAYFVQFYTFEFPTNTL